MPTSAELERLDALTKQIAPLAKTQSGSLIRAQDWNTVVGALIDVARATLASSAAETIPVHEHLEQVTLAWLDPRLRELMQRGPLADPGAVAKLSELDRRLARLEARLDSTDGQLGDVRNRVVDVTTRDLKREKDVTETRRAVDGLSDARNDVAAVRETLRGVQADLGTALDAAQRFTVNGQPVDFADVMRRIGEVEQLRTRLTAPDGTLFDASALEGRLGRLTNTLVTQDQLTTALNQRTGRLSAEELDGLRAGIGNDLRAGFNTSLEEVKSSLRGEITTRFADEDVRIGRAIADATPALRSGIRADVRQDIDGAVARSAADVASAATRALDARSAELRGDMTRSVEALRSDVVATVRGEVATQLPPLLEPTRQSVAVLDTRMTRSDARVQDLSSRVDSSATQLTAQQTALADLTRTVDTNTRRSDARLATLETRTAEFQSSLGTFQTRVSDLDRTVGNLDRDTRLRFTTAATETRTAIDAASATNRERIVGDVSDVATTAARSAAAAEVQSLRGDLETSLETTTRGLVATEVAAARTQLNSEMQASVRSQVGEGMTQLQASVRSEVSREVATVRPQIRTDIVNSIGPGRLGGG